MPHARAAAAGRGRAVTWRGEARQAGGRAGVASILPLNPHNHGSYSL